MAVITDQSKLLQDDEEQAGQGLGKSQPVGSLGESSVVSGGPEGSSGAPGKGSGGTPGYVNMKSYVDASRGNTGTASALEGEANKAIGAERERFGRDSQSRLSQAQSQRDSLNLRIPKISDAIRTQPANRARSIDQGQGGTEAPTQAPSVSDYLSRGTGSYGRDGYQSAVSDLQSKIKNPFGVQGLQWNPSADYQSFAQNLEKPENFGAAKNALYDKMAGGQMSTGQKALQRQLDQGNAQLFDVRDRVLGQMAGLRSDFDATNSNIEGAKASYEAQQKAIQDYLGKQASAYRDQLQTGLEGYKQPGATLDNLPGYDEQKKSLNYILDVLGRGGEKVGMTAPPPPPPAELAAAKMAEGNPYQFSNADMKAWQNYISRSGFGSEKAIGYKRSKAEQAILDKWKAYQDYEAKRTEQLAQKNGMTLDEFLRKQGSAGFFDPTKARAF